MWVKQTFHLKCFLLGNQSSEQLHDWSGATASRNLVPPWFQFLPPDLQPQLMFEATSTHA